MSKRIVIFNGPPRAGKDTACHAILDESPGGLPHYPLFERLSLPIKRAFAGLMTAACDRYGNVYPYENNKDELIPAIGMSYRNWQIFFSEICMKPECGQLVFAKLFADRVKASNTQHVLVSSCGFQPEFDHIAEAFGRDNVMVVNILRDGTSFKGDSRTFINSEGCYTIGLQNNDDEVETFKHAVRRMVIPWLLEGYRQEIH